MPNTSWLRSLLVLALCTSLSASGFVRSAPVRVDREGERWARKTLKKLSLEEKIGQMFMVRGLVRFMNVEDPDYLRLRDQISRYHVGSVLLSVPSEGAFLSRSEPYETAMLANQLQRDSRLPLIVAADFERGPSMRLNGVTPFPHAMAFGAAGKPEFAEEFGRIVASESRALGVEWNFFPVADVNSNPENPIINTRSFGEDPAQVSALVAAYIRGARQEGMMTTAKHFPGHGDTGTDSHLGLAAVNRSRDQIEQIDLVPFRGAIAAGVDGIMVAHVTAPALDPDPGKVATTSSAIVTDLLKKEMRFHGLAVTDALEMGGLTRLYPQGGAAASGRAAVDAVRAGNDLLLLPSDLAGAFDGVLNAVRSGEIRQSRIDESVLKILEAKASVGLNKGRMADIGAISSLVAKPASLAFAEKVAGASITLVRENGRVLPLRNRGTFNNAPAYGSVEHPSVPLVCLVLTDDIRTESGRRLERELRARVHDVRMIYVDPRIAAGMAALVQEAIGPAEKVLVAVYMVPTAGKVVKTDGAVPGNSVALAQTPAALLQSVLDTAREKTVVVAFGSPYIAGDFPQIENYICAYTNVPISEAAAVRALFGEAPVQGHLPVTIPGFAPRGTGIRKAAE
ncbi:MAG TPA: glycoside hydrolase family 3 N-terminal domain-containing protein [Verrucomicrobiae bacterium]|jgi:beta-N-acetylhexosaminidase|nr:glycoside hydrolase family 3 N-terminal domain-containing protein [Verrucomicrobiae bacterium]